MAHSDYFSEDEKEMLTGNPDEDFIFFQAIVTPRKA
jgi:hypothetical protein